MIWHLAPAFHRAWRKLFTSAYSAAGRKRSWRRQRPIEPKIITDPELVTEVFTEYGIIVLCNVRR